MLKSIRLFTFRYMYVNEEIKALIALLDDPDPDVYNMVKSHFLSLNLDVSELILELKALHYNDLVITRLEEIHTLSSANTIALKLDSWANIEDKPCLLEALLIINNWIADESSEAFLRQQVENIRKNIWLEMNQYLTTLEQLHVFNSIVYNFYNLHTEDVGVSIPDSKSYYLTNILSSQVGNRYSLACLYLYLSDQFNLPIRPVYLPNNELYLMFYQDVYLIEEKRILGFIHPGFGNVVSYQEMLLLLKNEISSDWDESYLEPLSYPALMALFIEQLQVSLLVEKEFAKSKALETVKETLIKFLPSHLQ